MFVCVYVCVCVCVHMWTNELMSSSYTHLYFMLWATASSIIKMSFACRTLTIDFHAPIVCVCECVSVCVSVCVREKESSMISIDWRMAVEGKIAVRQANGERDGSQMFVVLTPRRAAWFLLVRKRVVLAARHRFIRTHDLHATISPPLATVWFHADNYPRSSFLKMEGVEIRSLQNMNDYSKRTLMAPWVNIWLLHALWLFKIKYVCPKLRIYVKENFQRGTGNVLLGESPVCWALNTPLSLPLAV